MPNDGWGRDRVGVLLMRTEELGADISTIRDYFTSAPYNPFQQVNPDSQQTPGLVVLRGPDDRFPTVSILIQALLNGLSKDTTSGHLWIVESSRIRIHE